MISAVCMLESSAAAAKLHMRLKNHGIELERHNFHKVDEIVNHVIEHPDICAVVISESALNEIQTDSREALETIRIADPTIRVIFVKENLERDPDFEMWCYQWQIYDITYMERHSDIDVNAVISAISRGRLSWDEPPPLPPVMPDVQQTEQSKQSRLLDKLKGLTVPNIKLPSLPEIKLPTLPKINFPMKRSSAEEQHTQDSGIKSIGVVSCSRGFGATTLTVSMARCLTEAGYRVAVLAMDMSSDLKYAGLTEMGVMVCIPSADYIPSLKALEEYNQYVIVDFGVVYEFLPSGVPIPAQSSAQLAMVVKDTLKSCNMNIYLTSAEPWHVKKSRNLKNIDPNGEFINIRDADAYRILNKIGVI